MKPTEIIFPLVLLAGAFSMGIGIGILHTDKSGYARGRADQKAEDAAKPVVGTPEQAKGSAELPQGVSRLKEYAESNQMSWEVNRSLDHDRTYYCAEALLEGVLFPRVECGSSPDEASNELVSKLEHPNVPIVVYKGAPAPQPHKKPHKKPAKGPAQPCSPAVTGNNNQITCGDQ